MSHRIFRLVPSLALNLVEHLEHVHGYRFLISCLLVDSDLLKRDLTLSHHAVRPDKLTLHQEISIATGIVLLCIMRFLTIYELSDGLSVFIDKLKVLFLDGFDAASEVI